MTKRQSSPLKHMEWIAIGAYAEAAPLAAAVTNLTAAGMSLPDLCLAGTPASMTRVAAAPEVRGNDHLAALIRSAVEVEAPGSGAAIVAVPSCAGDASAFLGGEMADRLRGLILDGFILLGVPAASATDAARAGNVLLRNSSRHVHVLQLDTRRPLLR